MPIFLQRVVQCVIDREDSTLLDKDVDPSVRLNVPSVELTLSVVVWELEQGFVELSQGLELGD